MKENMSSYIETELIKSIEKIAKDERRSKSLMVQMLLELGIKSYNENKIEN